MQEFIKLVTQQLGITDSAASSVTGGLLSLAKDKLGSGDFDSLLGNLPGVSDLISSYTSSATSGSGSSGGGLLGNLASVAASAVGGKLGSAVEVANLFSQNGIETSKMGQFGELFASYIKDNVGEDSFGQILNKIPELKSLVG